jgi:aspartate/tyrosine/aromatic aminotransferase
MTEDEQIVRKAWKWAQVRLANPFEGFAKGKWVARLSCCHSQTGFNSEAEAWSAARAFTEERREQIRCLESEIEDVQDLLDADATMAREAANNGDPYIANVGASGAAAYLRILIREQAALAELKRGLHEGVTTR